MSILKQTKILPAEYERYSVYAGDLLVCEGGEAGRAAIWNGDRIFYQNALHRIRAFEGMCQKFIYYALLYSKERGWIDELSNGVTIKHFTTKSMAKLAIAVPPYEEQKRIVESVESILKTIDAIDLDRAN